jgi:ribosomal protein L21
LRNRDELTNRWKKGDKIEISEVHSLADGEVVKIGTPYVEGSKLLRDNITEEG